MSGFIKIHRKILKNPLFVKNPHALFVFQVILILAEWDDTEIDWNGRPVSLSRGQALVSIRTLMAHTGLSLQKVRTILNRLANHKVVKINTDGSSRPMVITVCKYSEYQGYQHRGNTGPNIDLTQTQHSTKEEEEIEEGKEVLSRGTREREMRDALVPNYDSGVLVKSDRTVELRNGFKARWLETFGGEERLDLALSGFQVQENSRTPPEAQVARFLGRQAGERIDRDRRYERKASTSGGSKHDAASTRNAMAKSIVEKLKGQSTQRENT